VRCAFLSLGIAIITSALSLGAQSSNARAFDAAIVKRNTSATVETTWVPEPGRFTATNVTLKGYISTAFGEPQQPLANFQISGGPSWIDSERFDISATAPGATAVEMMPMLRRLLEEQFQLRTHVETRQLPVYSLTLVHRDGTLGPGLRRNAVTCDSAAPHPGQPPCGGGTIHPGALTARGASMPQIVNGLARLMPGVNRLVLDRTGLSGSYDIDLTWTPSAVELPDHVDANANGPSLFTAIQEQWGLKLEPATGAVPVLVIDSAVMPRDN
jgi:uncharacterized protein (TIGR03435 family)